MLIKSNLKGPHSVPLPVRDTRTPEDIEKERKEGVTPRSVTGLVAPHKLFIIFSGYNNMPHEVWEVAAPEIKDLIDSGDFDVSLSKKDKTREGALESLDLWDLPAKDAREVIKKTFNARDISFWLSHDKVTPELRHLIQIQKEGIESGAAPKWGDEPRGR